MSPFKLCDSLSVRCDSHSQTTWSRRLPFLFSRRANEWEVYSLETLVYKQACDTSGSTQKWQRWCQPWKLEIQSEKWSNMSSFNNTSFTTYLPANVKNVWISIQILHSIVVSLSFTPDAYMGYTLFRANSRSHYSYLSSQVCSDTQIARCYCTDEDKPRLLTKKQVSHKA